VGAGAAGDAVVVVGDEDAAGDKDVVADRDSSDGCDVNVVIELHVTTDAKDGASVGVKGEDVEAQAWTGGEAWSDLHPPLAADIDGLTHEARLGQQDACREVIAKQTQAAKETVASQQVFAGYG